MKKLNKIEVLKNLTKQHPNDMDLGEIYRDYYGVYDKHCIDFPNNMDLGKFIRSLNFIQKS